MRAACALLLIAFAADTPIRLGEPAPATGESHGIVVLSSAKVPDAARQAIENAGARVSAWGNSASVLSENGIARRILTGPPADWAQQVRSWKNGQPLYMEQCARCHGPDGNDTAYSGIKKLGGIGNRLDERTILDRVSNVDLHALSEDDRKALAAYVAGL